MKTSRNTAQKPTVLSLFSGAGGLDLGLIRAGAQIRQAIDSDRDACQTYTHNLGNHILQEDVTQIDFKQWSRTDLVIGGFPCQGFSNANRLRHREDSRNLLYLQLLRSLEEVQPKMFLAENVRGILSLDKGQVIRQILCDFRSAGYETEYHLVNAVNYGVPQNRWRVFFVGVHRDFKSTFVPPDPTHRDPMKPTLDPDVEPWITISQALKGVPEPDAEHALKNHVGSLYKVTDRNFTGHRRTDPNKPSPTVLARGNGKGGVCAVQHPNHHRRLTVRECAILQTFPDEFEFSGGLMSMYRQIGNAVPVRLAEAFARSLLDCDCLK